MPVGLAIATTQGRGADTELSPRIAVTPDLPVTEALPRLLAALEARRNAVLVAPPGAGKTTLVPPALLEAPFTGRGTILVLEPRRIAARAAARRMAALFGEEPGGVVGYAMRLDRRTSAATRILVVTEGLLARMILDDPELTGIAAIVFDEVHERSLDGDFGLALALDVHAGLRPDLRLVAMSATLDGARVGRLLGDAPVVESAGRAFPVALRYRERAPAIPVEEAVAAAIREALADEPGSILAFLPGRREIERTAERLQGRVGATVDIVPLHGRLEGRDQDRAIRPAEPGRRKVVLATSIAETSVTIDGVRVVVDCGLSRVPRYEPSTGLTRLETVRVSRASADQRAGRAGRTAPGVAIRLWRGEQTGALAAFQTPEILEADLSGLLLDCAAFGVADPGRLPFLDPPPAPAVAEARTLLVALGAIDADGRITPVGRAMRAVGLPVRLAHMVAEAAAHGLAGDAAELAVLLGERGLGGDGTDLDERWRRFRADRSPRATASRALARRIAADAARDGSRDRPDALPAAGELLLWAWPDRVGKARGARGRFVLANGSGGVLDPLDALAGEPYLVVADLQGTAQTARIAAAAAVSEAAIRGRLGDRLAPARTAVFDPDSRSVRAREQERLGAVVLADRTLPAPSGPAADAAILAAVRAHGPGLLDWSDEAASLRARLAWLHHRLGAPWPDVSDAALIDRLDRWLAPFLTGRADLAAVTPAVLRQALLHLLPTALARAVDVEAPTHFDAPSGSRVPIRYDAEQPVLAIRVQELFGLRLHPSIAHGTVPLTLELLSPAHRPIQTTRDLPAFWAGSWAEVRAEMRGRYPRHDWPPDPAAAMPTSRAKPRSR